MDLERVAACISALAEELDISQYDLVNTLAVEFLTKEDSNEIDDILGEKY